MSNLLAGLLFTLWLVLTALAFYWFSDEQLVEFDPNNQLDPFVINSQTRVELQNKLTTRLARQVNQLANQVYLVTLEDCQCNNNAQIHLNKLTDQLINKGFEFNEISLESLKAFLPAAPAILVFGDEGQLIYMGPLSSGYLCNSQNSMVEMSVDSAINANVPAMIINDAKGCYCHL